MRGYFTCFGYGSLVNRQTLPDDAHSVRVRVRGWRRAWRLTSRRSDRPRCTLTVVPDPDSEILGTVIAQPEHHEDALQQREMLYERQDLDASCVEWIDGRPGTWPDPFIHVGAAAHSGSGDADHPILLSYIETVMAGFLNTFGDNGPRHFVATTSDWHVPVLNDRHQPFYPRAKKLADCEQSLVDDLLREIGVTIIED